jgi:hypothetical protein
LRGQPQLVCLLQYLDLVHQELSEPMLQLQQLLSQLLELLLLKVLLDQLVELPQQILQLPNR